MSADRRTVFRVGGSAPRSLRRDDRKLHEAGRLRRLTAALPGAGVREPRRPTP